MIALRPVPNTAYGDRSHLAIEMDEFQGFVYARQIRSCNKHMFFTLQEVILFDVEEYRLLVFYS